MCLSTVDYEFDPENEPGALYGTAYKMMIERRVLTTIEGEVESRYASPYFGDLPLQIGRWYEARSTFITKGQGYYSGFHLMTTLADARIYRDWMARDFPPDADLQIVRVRYCRLCARGTEMKSISDFGRMAVIPVLVASEMVIECVVG